MADSIRVLIVDDLPETRENVRKLLQFESDIKVIGQAGTGEQAIEMAQEHEPDIILMDINMPGIDGIGASQKITEMIPGAQIIIMSVQSDSDYLRRAMLAGARDFLTKPFGGDELVAAIRRVHEKRPQLATRTVQARSVNNGPVVEDKPLQLGRVIGVYSPKGGSGCTTIAINLAVSIARQNHRTILVDGSLQFGDVAVMMDLKPTTSIVDLSDRGVDLDQDLISSVVQMHRSGLHVLLAPPKPEMADVVTEASVRGLLEGLRQNYEFVIIDTSTSLSDVALSILDSTDNIVLITQQNLPSLKNISRFFDLADSLDYSKDKTWMVVNRVSSKPGITVKDVADTLKRPVFFQVPDDVEAVEKAVNEGVPLVIGANRKRPVSIALGELANQIIRELGSSNGKAEKDEPAEKNTGFLKRLLGRKT